MPVEVACCVIAQLGSNETEMFDCQRQGNLEQSQCTLVVNPRRMSRVGHHKPRCAGSTGLPRGPQEFEWHVVSLPRTQCLSAVQIHAVWVLIRLCFSYGMGNLAMEASQQLQQSTVEFEHMWLTA